MSKKSKVSCSSVDSEGDLIHAGIVIHKIKGKLSTSFHTVACSLHRDTLDDVRRLELRDSHSGKVSVVVLTDLLDVKENAKKQKENYYPFEVICLKSKHTFVTETPEERKEWISTIKRLFSGEPEPGVTYEYRVTVQANESSKRYRLSGNYVLRVTETSIRLYSATGLIETAFRLRLSDIKRLQQCSLTDKNGLKEDILVIYSMPNSGIGEGTYVFSATNAGEISRLIDKRIKLLLDCGLSSGTPSGNHSPVSPPPPLVPDRKHRNMKPFETHTYHEKERTDLYSSWHGHSQKKMSADESRILSESLPASSFEKLNQASHRRTLSSIRPRTSTEAPPTPPPRQLKNQRSYTSSESSQADEPILVEAKDILASVHDLRKKGLLRGVSMDKTPSPPPPPRPQVQRNLSEQRIRDLPNLQQHCDWSFNRASSQSPPSSSSSTSMWSPNSPQGNKPSLDSLSRHQQTRRVANQAKLIKSHSGDGAFPLDYSSRSDHSHLVKRQNTAEQLRLSQWLPQKLKQSRNLPDVPSRDRSDSDAYYLSNIDINPGPVKNVSRVGNPLSQLSGSEVSSMTSSSTDDNGYLILKADERDMMRQMAKEHAEQMREKTASGTVQLDSPELHSAGLGNGVTSEHSTQSPTLPGGHTHSRNGFLSNGETHDNHHLMNSPTSITSDRESSGSPYYNMAATGGLQQNGAVRKEGHSSSLADEEEDDSDLDHAATWTRPHREDSPEYYNPVPVNRANPIAPNGTRKLSGQLLNDDNENADEEYYNTAAMAQNIEGELGKNSTSSTNPNRHINAESDSDYYNDPLDLREVAKISKRVLVRKSSSITGLNQITPCVSATDYSGIQDGSDHNDPEGEREMSKLTRQRKGSANFQSIDNLQS
jgi:hypothetical protein